MDIKELLAVTIKRNASDLHLAVGSPPIIRVDGDLQKLEGPVLEDSVLLNMIHEVMTEKQQKVFAEKLEIDFAYALADTARFRVNAFHQQHGAAVSFRVIPAQIPTLQELGLPKILEGWCLLQNGLILVTGPTGSGKSTSLAAMINYINENQYAHIITIEDPIEFSHHSKNCLINQREVNRDTLGFGIALRSALREDPDIILVGEMRDLETVRLALTAAETGHLVFATLHTNSAPKTIDRIVDVFPAGEKEMIRSMLSESLRVVISQTLLKRVGGGRVAALEIMFCTPAIRNLIRENKLAQIYSLIQTGQAHGMCTLDRYIKQLISAGMVEEAVGKTLFRERDKKREEL